MFLKKIILSVATGTLFASLVSNAFAGDIRVRCEVRSDRSKVSVDGKNMIPGRYRAIIQSGDRTRASSYADTDGDEVEFDFDSERDDIAEGDIQIPASFIRQGRVTARLQDDRGFLSAQDSVSCRIRR